MCAQRKLRQLNPGGSPLLNFVLTTTRKPEEQFDSTFSSPHIKNSLTKPFSFRKTAKIESSESTRSIPTNQRGVLLNIEVALPTPTMNRSRDEQLSNHHHHDRQQPSISSCPPQNESTIRIKKVTKVSLVDGLGRGGIYTGCIDLQTGKPHGDGEMRYHHHPSQPHPENTATAATATDGDGRDNDVYNGGWVNGDWSGYGTYTNPIRQVVYEGGFFDNLKHGVGIECYQDGSVCEGTYQLGTIVGKGTMSYPDGSYYWGYFSSSSSSSIIDNNNNNNNDRHHQRQCHSPHDDDGGGDKSSRVLIPVPHGRGKYTYADGSIYDGLFQNGIRHGHGRMTWSDGRWYLGEWIDGERNGLGIEVLSNGKLGHEGIFCNDKTVTPSSFQASYPSSSTSQMMNMKRKSSLDDNDKNDNNNINNNNNTSPPCLLYRSSFADRARLVGPLPSHQIITSSSPTTTTTTLPKRDVTRRGSSGPILE